MIDPQSDDCVAIHKATAYAASCVFDELLKRDMHDFPSVIRAHRDHINEVLGDSAPDVFTEPSQP